MEIREYKTYNESEILRLYTSVGWTAYTDQPEVLRKGFEGSMLTLAYALSYFLYDCICYQFNLTANK